MQIRAFSTIKDKNPLEEIEVYADPPNSSKDIKLIINPDKKYQTLLGIGGALTESAAFNLSKMPLEMQNKVIKDYFDSNQGNGYSFCRTHINSCDFSLENYSCLPGKDDWELETFSMERHEKYVIPMLYKIFKIEPGVKLLISPWSPPSWMKTNNEMNNGGKLHKKYYPLWAKCFVRFLKELEQRGLPVWAITAQNEPDAKQTWESCLYTAEEEAEFIGRYLGPSLSKSGLSHIKILGWDHNRDKIFQRANKLLSDENCCRELWGLGFHWYSGMDSENLSQVQSRYPGVPLILTEACIEGGAKPGKWDRGEIYARHIIEDLNHWASGWIDWNLILDSEGGPNHKGNYCDSPVLYEEESKTLIYQSSYYFLGHFSRFIKPGAIRISCERNNDPDIYSTAFKNSDDSLVVVVLNVSPISYNLQLSIGNEKMYIQLNPHSILSTIIETQ